MKRIGLVIVLLAVSSTMAQRPFYAPFRRFPTLLPRFRPENQGTQSEVSQTSQNITDDLGNRVGIETTTPVPLPTDLQGTLHEDSLVQRVSQWPEEKQPFWFKNRHVVANQRQQPVDGNGRSDNDNKSFRPKQETENSQQVEPKLIYLQQSSRENQWSSMNNQQQPSNSQQQQPWRNQEQQPWNSQQQQSWRNQEQQPWNSQQQQPWNSQQQQPWNNIQRPTPWKLNNSGQRYNPQVLQTFPGSNVSLEQSKTPGAKRNNYEQQQNDYLK